MGKSSPRYYIKSKAKTFAKHSGSGELFSWIHSAIVIERNLPDYDAEEEWDSKVHYSRLAKKYVITVKEIR